MCKTVSKYVIIAKAKAIKRAEKVLPVNVPIYNPKVKATIEKIIFVKNSVASFTL